MAISHISLFVAKWPESISTEDVSSFENVANIQDASPGKRKVGHFTEFTSIFQVFSGKLNTAASNLFLRFLHYQFPVLKIDITNGYPGRGPGLRTRADH
jgi:hypothetical protein